MARRDIKGITIEINGSTTGLNKALSGVNSTLSTVQRSLKDTEHLLKLDPKNTELLRQKQSLLKEAIEETNKKLELEKEALKQAADQNVPADKMDALQREIIDTTQQLDALKEKAGETGKTFSESMAEAGAAMEAAGEKVKAVGDKMSDVGGAMSKTITAPIVAAAGASVAAFNEVDAGLDVVTTKTGATGDALKEMQDIAKEIPTTMNVGFEAAGAAVGEVNTRFGSTGEQLDELSRKFLKFSELNEVDVSTSIDEVQKAMEANNVAVEDAGDFLDTLNKVAQNTGINVIALAQSMTKNAPAMKELGFNASDSANFLGNLEKKGIDATVVTSGLSKALANAAKDGKTMPQALAELQKSMEDASSETEATQAAMELFGNKAGPAIAKAVREGQLSFDALGTSLADNAGNIEQTFNEIQDAPDKFAQNMNTVKVIGADVGATILDMLVPALETMHTLLNTARERWNSLSEEQKRMIITIAAVAAAIGPVLVIGGNVVSLIGSIMSGIGSMQTSIAAVTGAIGGISAPVIAVIAGITALIAIFVVLYNTNDEFRAKVQEVWGSIQELIAAVLEAIQNGITAFCNTVQAFWAAHGDQIMAVAGAAWGFISETVTNAMAVINGIIKTVTAIISGDWEGAWNGIKETASATWNLITGIIDTGINAGKAVIDTVLDAIGSKFTSIWDGAKTTVSTAIDFIKGLFNFQWSLPRIPLPHFSVQGSFGWSLDGGVQLPHVSVDWYDKAMDKVRVLTGPSLFGYDSKANKLLGGGESGREVVSGEAHLLNLIDGVVGGRLAALGGVFGRVNALLDKYLPEIVKGQERPVMLDTGQTVGGIGKRMNEQLNEYSERDKWQ